MYLFLKLHRTVWLTYCLGVIVGMGCRPNSATRSESQLSPERPSAAKLPTWTTRADGLEAAPLPTREPVAGTRFESLPVERTGIDFAHNWTPPPEYQLEIYNSLPGGGICIGDYDRDGWPDVFLTQPNVGSRLYRNLGDFRFEDVTARTVGEIPFGQGASMVDIDNDGDLDLYVCNNERPNQLFVNDGRGRFKEQAAAFGLDFNGASVMMAFADYDLDGDLDGYLVTNRKDEDGTIPRPRPRPDGTYEIAEEHREFVDVIVPEDGRPRIIKAAQYDHLYRNNGDGTFTDVSRSAGLVGNYWGLAATWWDYDRDGWPDLYVANDFYSPDQLYRNNQDGTFTDVAPMSLPHTPWYSMGCDVADLNNDGWLDLMGSDMSATNHYKQKASMGDMSTTAWFLTHPIPRQYMRNALYLNTGTDRFMEIAHLAGVANTDWTWSLKFADLDEDGWSDLFVTNGMNRDWTNSDLRNQSNQAASEDEKMQIWLASPQRRDANLAFRNRGDLRFESVGDDWGVGAEKVSYGAALADLDRDGDLDLVVNNAEEAPGVYRNRTSHAHRVLVRLQGTASNRWGIGATVSITHAKGSTGAGLPKVSQMRYLTSCQGYMSANEPLVHFGLGRADRIERLQVRWPSGRTQTFLDLPADHYYVIRESTSAGQMPPAGPEPGPRLFHQSPVLASTIHREIPFNDFARQPLLPNQLSQLGPGMACGDIDGDGDTDLFLGGSSGYPGQLLVNRDGQFEVTKGGIWHEDAACEDMGALFFDADGDNDLDLYVVSGGVECEPGDEVLQDRLYLNDGQGHFSRAPADALPNLRDSGSVVAAADFDRDGDLDLFVGGRVIPGQYPLTPNSRLLRNDGGRFHDVVQDRVQDGVQDGVQDWAAGLQRTGLVTSALWSDVDQDGWTDLLVTHEWGPLKLYRNQAGRLVDRTQEAGLAEHVGWYNSIAAGDFDGDGDLDYVVGNVGWNTKYHASVERPALLYYGDFEQSGRMRLVEAEYEHDTLFPVRGKSCSTNAMPFLRNKFERFHDFAVASLQEIYTPRRLNSSHRFAANSLTTGIWLNDGAGRFVFRALPTMAQASPTFGIVTGDLDGDGKLDLFLAQNFFGPQPETGRADGGVGLLLAGNGDGTFTPVAAHRSGIVVPGDATSACLVDVNSDGVPEILVATNDGPVYTFEQANSRGSHYVVRLSGRDANPRAIGARVTACFSDGTAQQAEVSCGGGYLSQSDTDLYFSGANGARIERLDVTWPTGTATSSAPAEDDGLIIVSYPVDS